MWGWKVIALLVLNIAFSLNQPANQPVRDVQDWFFRSFLQFLEPAFKTQARIFFTLLPTTHPWNGHGHDLNREREQRATSQPPLQVIVSDGKLRLSGNFTTRCFLWSSMSISICWKCYFRTSALSGHRCFFWGTTGGTWRADMYEIPAFKDLDNWMQSQLVFIVFLH